MFVIGENKENRKSPVIAILKSYSFITLILFVVFSFGVYIWVVTQVSIRAPPSTLTITDHEVEMLETERHLDQTFQKLGKIRTLHIHLHQSAIYEIYQELSFAQLLFRFLHNQSICRIDRF